MPAAQGSVSAVSSYSFPWNTANVSNGPHTLTATAADAAGNTASTSITLNVNNAVAAPPTVTITAPANNASVSGTVSVYVNVVSSVGMAKVELYVDGALKSTATSAPYTTKWNTRREAAGAHSLSCMAYDMAGNVARSAPVTAMK